MTTKTIKTYGKNDSERVVNNNTLNCEMDEKLGETINLSGNKPINGTAKKKNSASNKSTTSKSQKNKDIASDNAEKKPTKQKKKFTKGFTKYKHPVQPSQNFSPKHSTYKTMVREKTASPSRMPLTPKKHEKKNHCNEPLVIITPLNKLNTLPSGHSTLLNYEKENLYSSLNDQLETELSYKYLEIVKLVKHEQIDDLMRLLRISDQDRLWTFEEFLGTDCLNRSTKIGEASFSEVYMTYAPNFTSTRVKCVLKIIPFGTGEEQCSISDITQEIKTTSILGGRTGLDPELRIGFLKLYGVGICRGSYPEVLLNEWDIWHKKYKSENNRPDFYNEKQLYAVLIVEYGGIDLEHIKLKNWTQAWSILTQIGWSTAQAEKTLRFEHRDLHWGNITIKPTKIKSISYNVHLDDANVEVETFGVRACIIDYTLSRMEYEDEVIYVNILNDEYFIGEGDYQYDVYRMMREESKADWRSFWPRTNVIWLHYISSILGFKKRALTKNGGYKSAVEAMNVDKAWRL
ncbi:serine/threonine-protein kinase haspin [Rhizophagus clarus]|uniref:non-specific serine/threonine protein kinase n=1 Tax=Rhizophagus clarus TaxID=94130 RepID=A0A8H3KVX7_9GLOM|nr:serine/threonine-protein kinase haspin [Rhizophagus clarus]